MLGRIFVFAACVCVALGVPLSGVVHEDEDVVTTTTGPIRGELLPNSRAFRGVRYGAELSGKNRFSAPVAPESWTEIKNATVFGAGCPQKCVLPPGTCPDTYSEDCLFLNVFTPRLSAVRPPEGWPVMAFIHGGRFEQGSGTGILYEGDPLVQEGVVLVSFNYRLNLFGFLATEGADALDGNHGFKDQQLALRWIQDNVARFGGNPSSVTVFGQSAGGTSIAAHLASPGSEGLLHRAIIQSNPWAMRIRETEDAVNFGMKFVKAAGCEKENHLECLRSKTTDELLAAIPKVKVFPEPHPLNAVYRFTPVADGKLITEQPMLMIKAGKIRTVPMIVGTTFDDGRLFIYELSEKPLTRTAYRIANVAVFGKHASETLKHYPDTNLTDGRDLISVETTDCIFTCPTRYVADQVITTQSPAQSAPVYIYRFDHAISWDAWGPTYSYCRGYSCHASELPYVFGTSAVNFTSPEMDLSNACKKYWTNFAKSGDPNYDGGVQWAQYDVTARKSIVLDTPVRAIDNVIKESCDFWDGLDWYQNQ